MYNSVHDRINGIAHTLDGMQSKGIPKSWASSNVKFLAKLKSGHGC